jgi:hypothetical protein
MGLFKQFFSAIKNRHVISGDGGPRCDHYSFTHVVLRKAAFDNPAHAVTKLASVDAGEMLDELWLDVRAICKQHNEAVSIDPADILIHKSRVATFPCVLLEMPTPANPTEAFLVAMVLTIDLSDTERGFQETPIRYFTLELAESDNDEIQTVVGEWFADESHQIHGPGPAPALDLFVAAITNLATQRRVE